MCSRGGSPTDHPAGSTCGPDDSSGRGTWAPVPSTQWAAGAAEPASASGLVRRQKNTVTTVMTAASASNPMTTRLSRVVASSLSVTRSCRTGAALVLGATVVAGAALVGAAVVGTVVWARTATSSCSSTSVVVVAGRAVVRGAVVAGRAVVRGAAVVGRAVVGAAVVAGRAVVGAVVATGTLEVDDGAAGWAPPWAATGPARTATHRQAPRPNVARSRVGPGREACGMAKGYPPPEPCP